MNLITRGIAAAVLTAAAASMYPAASHASSPARVVSASAKVTMTGSAGSYAFSPATLTVKKGTKVTFSNPSDSDAPHTVTFSSGATFDKQVAVGASVSYTFKKVGTYKYFCKYHSSMKGVIKVK